MNYGRYRAAALGKLKRYGSAVSITRYGGEVYDATTDTYTRTNPVVLGGYGIDETYETSKVDGVNIRRGDSCLMCVLDGVPAVGDAVVFGGATYTAVRVIPLSPDGGAAIYWEIQLRSGG